MFTRWTSHLKTEDEKQRFRNSVLGARVVLDRLLDIVKEDEESLGRSEQDQRVYDLPNWDYRQAHRNGVLQYLNTIRKVIDLDQQNGTNLNER